MTTQHRLLKLCYGLSLASNLIGAPAVPDIWKVLGQRLKIMQKLLISVHKVLPENKALVRGRWAGE